MDQKHEGPEALGGLRYGRLRFLFTAEGALELPPHPGSAWRGAFGWSLRELACVTRAQDCRGCPLAPRCIYQRLFEGALQGPPPPGMSGDRSPHPFVLETPDPARHAPYVALDVYLIGEGLRYAAEVTAALARAGRRGIGGAGNRLALARVQQRLPQGWVDILGPGGQVAPHPWEGIVPPSPPADSVRIRLTSPLRLVRQNRPLSAEALTPRVFIHALYARVRKLWRAQNLPETGYWPEIPPQAEFPERRLHWVELSRYSNRQRKRHPIGGLMGEFTLKLEAMEAVWPLLWHGQYLHVGKLTSMGHGAYRIVL